MAVQLMGSRLSPRTRAAASKALVFLGFGSLLAAFGASGALALGVSACAAFLTLRADLVLVVLVADMVVLLQVRGRWKAAIFRRRAPPAATPRRAFRLAAA